MLKPVYSNTGKIIEFRYNQKDVFDSNGILDFTGYPYVDAKYGFVKSILQNSAGIQLIIHNSDLLAWDTYKTLLSGREVWLVFTGSVGWGRPNTATDQCGSSKKRLLNAKKVLEEAGVKVRYFASEKTLKTAIEKRNKRFLKDELKKARNNL